MNTTMLDLIKQHRELKDRLIPESLQKSLDSFNKYKPTIERFIDTPLQSWEPPSSLMAIAAMTSRNDHTSTNALVQAAADAAQKTSEILNQNTVLSKISQILAAGENFTDKFQVPVALHEVLANQAKLNLGFTTNLFNTNLLADLSWISNPLREFNTSPVSQSFELFNLASKSFRFPDFSEIHIEQENEQKESKITIQIKPEDISQFIKDLYANSEYFYKIHPRKFEEVVAELLQYHGYHVTMTKQTRDGGFDMILDRILDNGIPFRAIVECKRYKNKIGVEVVRAFSAVAYREKISTGVIVTASAFTRDAISESKLMWPDLLLKDKKDLRLWVDSYMGKMPVIDLGFHN